MSDLDWSRLLKQQQQHQKQEEEEHQQQMLRIKKLYKKQLQRMIENKKSDYNMEKHEDKKLLYLTNQIQQRKIKDELEERLNKKRIKTDIAISNIKNKQLKYQQSLYQQQNQKQYLDQKYKKIESQLQQQKQRQAKARQQAQQKLSQVYSSQIHELETKRKLQKLEDMQFIKLYQDMQRKKQENRKCYIERIRNYYQQNPEVYEYSAQKAREQLRERDLFVSKLSSSTKQKEYELERSKIQQQTTKKTKQTSNYNKQSSQTKATRQRYQSLQDIADYQHRTKTLQNQLQHEKQRQQVQQQNKRKYLKMQLQKQIEESYKKQANKNKMNEKEYLFNLNRSGKMPSLPGLSRDYAVQKQFKILEGFLGAGRAGGVRGNLE